MAAITKYTFTQVKAKFTNIFEEVSEKKEIIIIKRDNSEDVALIAVSELNG